MQSLAEDTNFQAKVQFVRMISHVFRSGDVEK